MKKISLLCLATFSGIILAGCTNPLAEPQDFATVLNSHTQAIVEVLWPEGLTSGTGELELDGRGTGKTLSGATEFTFQLLSKIAGKDSETNLSLSGSTEIAELGGKTSAEASLDFIQKTGSGFVRLNSLSLITADPSVSGMIGGFVGSLKGKWFSLDGASGQYSQSGYRVDTAAVRTALQKHPIVSMTKDLGIMDGMYRYEVALNTPELLALQKDLYYATTGTGMTPEELTKAQKSIETMSLSGVLMIDTDDREYGSFSGSYVILPVVSDIPEGGLREKSKCGGQTRCLGEVLGAMSGTIQATFSSDIFAIKLEDSEGIFDLQLNRELTKVAGTLTITNKIKNQKYPIAVEITKKEGKYSMDLSYTATLSTDSLQNGNLSLQGIFKKNPEIRIESPKEFTPLSKMMG